MMLKLDVKDKKKFEAWQNFYVQMRVQIKI